MFTTFAQMMNAARTEYIANTIKISEDTSFRIDDNNNLTTNNYLATVIAKKLGLSSLMEAYSLGKLLKAGIKQFNINAQIAEQLEYTDINIKLCEYKQPFSSIVIQLPINYQQSRMVYDPIEKSNQYPVAIVVHHNGSEELIKNTSQLIFVCLYFSHQQVNSTAVFDSNENVLIEDIIKDITKSNKNLGYLPIEESENMVSGRLTRMAINYMLLLGMKGCTKVGPQDPTRYARLLISRKKKPDSEGIKKEIMCQPIVYKDNLEQYVKIKVSKHGREAGEPTGKHTGPHWRRGHMANQPYGPQSSLRKLIWRQPTFVNAHLFTGDLSKVKVTYTED